uniref:NAC domain-containing protein n=1 Tax=Mesocestoides corti TaxID=53468 RepID=A0A5K3FVB6_MESCO
MSRPFMDPIFEPIFDPLENQMGFPCDINVPYVSPPGHVLTDHPRRDVILDNQPEQSFFSSSVFSSSSSFSSDSRGEYYESLKTSVKQPDGVIINTEVSRRNGSEVTTTTTIYPDGRQESRTETRGALRVDNPPAIMGPTDQKTGTGGIFSAGCIVEKFLDKVYVGEDHSPATVTSETKCIQGITLGVLCLE